MSQSTDLNPYAASEISIARPAPTWVKDPSLMWFAAPCVLGAWMVCVSYWNSTPQLGFGLVLLETLRNASLPAVTLVVAYAMTRFLFRQQYDYQSTVWSLVVGGVFAFLLMISVAYYHRNFPMRLSLPAGIVALAIPFAVVVVGIERWLVRGQTSIQDHAEDSGAIPIRQQSTHTSIFWFTGVAGVIVAVVGGLEFASQLASGGFDFGSIEQHFENLTFVLVIMTSSYGVVSRCVPRKFPAAFVARAAASAIWFFVMVTGMSLIASRDLAPILFTCFVVAPALAVTADRWVSRRQASIMDELSRAEIGDEGL